ncbi:MAG: hypothetical protein ABWY00_04085, partial [Dongiaceae bacterium]
MERRLWLCAGKLTRRYDAALDGAPPSIAATIFARHRHDLADLIAALAVSIEPQAGSTQGLSRQAGEPAPTISAAIWQDADAFLDHLGQLR